MVYALFWKGRRLRDLGTFKSIVEAETTKGIEATQMELAEYSPNELKRLLTIKKVKR